VPLIFCQPGRVPAAQTVETMTCHYDVYPSILSYLELDRPASRKPLPGTSYAAALRGDMIDWGREVVFHGYENTRAVQTHQLKYIIRHPDGPDEFYDLIADPVETRNVVKEPAYAEARAALAGRLGRFVDEYADPRYNLWRNGGSKAGRILDKAR
jgi:arylsulfatase A-like enzyme